MAKAMDAEAIAEAVNQLEETTKRGTVAEILATLGDDWGPDTDPDTWEAGFNAAITVIKENFVQ